MNTKVNPCNIIYFIYFIYYKSDKISSDYVDVNIDLSVLFLPFDITTFFYIFYSIRLNICHLVLLIESNRKFIFYQNL